MPELDPWWYQRCIHAWTALDNWAVLQEAEGAVVLRNLEKPMPIHVCVELDGVGSSCHPMYLREYEAMRPSQLMTMVQDMRRELRSLTQMP